MDEYKNGCWKWMSTKMDTGNGWVDTATSNTRQQLHARNKNVQSFGKKEDATEEREEIIR